MKTIDLKIEVALAEDLDNLKGLLQSVNLPAGDLPASLQNFLVIRDNDQIVGSVGLELYEKDALLRSLAIDQNYRNIGLANRLYEKIIRLAKDQGIEEVYLITTTADQYFAKRGFDIVSRDTVADTIKSTAQFSGICPSSAIVMKKAI